MPSLSGPPLKYWWQAILALPPSRSEVAYHRLERIFLDQTRPTRPDPVTGQRGQEFTDCTCETHHTVTLWENFVLFQPSDWLPQLWAVAELSSPMESVRRCNWSYEWAAHGGVGAPHCDVVLEYEDARGRGILVVEAKKPGKSLGEKDLSPGYYLEIPQLAAYQRRSLIYLVDDAARTKGESQVRRGSYDIGFLSWERLAAIQIDSVESMTDTPPAVRGFVAGSLYRSYTQLGITPKKLPLGYLQSEPSAEDVVAKRASRSLGEGDWQREIWRL